MEASRVHNRIARALRAPGYLILSFLVVQAIFDVVTSVSPMLPRLATWRVRALGVTASSLTAPLLAFLLLFALALATQSRVAVKILSVVTALGTLALMAGSGIFALDAVQVSRGVQVADKARYAISVAYALAKLGIGILSLALLTWGGAKAARAVKKEAVAAAASKANVLIRTQGAQPGAARVGEPVVAEPPVA